MATKRFDVYIWVTWLTSLLAGDASCWHQPWLKSHFKITKLDRGGFDLAGWKVQHTEMVEKRTAELLEAGWAVTLEDQNFFTLAGRVAKLAGKPDIVAIRGDEALIVDCKSGQRRASDIQQVLVYMFALPLASERFQTLRLAGEVQYPDGSIPIRPEQFTDELKARIIAAITKIGSSTVPPTTPSARECAFCDISKVDCPARIERVLDDVAVEVF